jgi:tripartite-type tricarboxylate transporter receptor subunit TctC
MRWTVLLAMMAGLGLCTGEAQAQYPNKPVHMIVPFIAGSAPDVVARQAAQRLTAGLGQQVVVENRPGAGGNIGAEVAARAAGDGYTLLLMTSSHLLNPYLYAKVNYDPIKDFVPITLLTRIPSLMVVPLSSPAKSVEAFIALAKSQPGRLNYGSGGAGSLAHLSAEAFRLAAGIDYVHVPYKGAPEIVLALLGDQIQVGFPTLPTAYPQARQGTLRALAVTSAKRSKVLPDVPTLVEAMPNGFALDAWLGLAAPAGTPPEIVERLHSILIDGLKDQAFRDVLEGDGSEIVFDTPAEFATLMQDETPKWQSLIKRVGVKIE